MRNLGWNNNQSIKKDSPKAVFSRIKIDIFFCSVHDDDRITSVKLINYPQMLNHLNKSPHLVGFLFLTLKDILI
jgi:hypothetical protein